MGARVRTGWTAPCVALSLLAACGASCGREIKEEPPIPEHRIVPCETWCALMFDPVCPAREVVVETEQECFDTCVVEEGTWAPVDETHDDCATTYLPYVECLDSLSCEEIKQHFALVNVVPSAERSSCGALEEAQLECQAKHY